MSASFAKIDFHMHSTVSDGTDTPTEILARTRALGITCFALTDHDAIAGCLEIKRVKTKEDPAFLCGAEFSCEDGEGKYHILGYGYDPTATSIVELVASCHSFRINKVQQRLDFLEREFGIAFSAEEQAALVALSNPGKPHMAKLLIAHGYVSSIKEGFDRYLNKYRGEEKHILPSRAILAITEAGGIPILAHPSYGSGDELIVGKEMEKRLQRLMDMGIRGIEAFYSGFSHTLQQELLSLADRYDLYVTAGSDYHGSNKLVVLGDTNLDSATERPQGLLRFLRDVEETGKLF